MDPTSLITLLGAAIQSALKILDSDFWEFIRKDLREH